MTHIHGRKTKTVVAVLILLAMISFSAFAEGLYEKNGTGQLPLIMQEMQTATTPVLSVSESGAARIQKDMASLSRLYKHLDDEFLWDIDYDAVYNAMAKAMFDALGDKYTYFVSSEESADYEEESLGEYGGLGFYHTKTYIEYQDPEDISTIYCNIMQVFPNSPAAYGGLKAGDMITHIDGVSVIDKEGTECSRLIKGEVGTTVTLTILRGGASFEQTFVRAKVNVPSLVSTMIEDTDIGYIKFLQFYQNTAEDAQKTIEELLSEGMKSLIIDLRDCPGGMVDSSLAIADMFIASSKLLTIHYKDSTKDREMWASNNLLVDPSVKVAILINENSASSSEILAATMRDNGRATLVGAKTYGKGIMQAISLYGDSDMSITVASFIPPSGKEIHEVGVEPDILVPSLVVTEDMAQAYSDMIRSSIVEDFVDRNSEYTVSNVRLFAEENVESGLPEEILHAIAVTEYYSRMTYDEQPVCDTWFDSQLKAAIEFLQEEK